MSGAGGEEPTEGAKDDVASWLDVLGAWGDEREALVAEGRSLSWAALAAAVAEAGSALVGLGLEAGDRVAVLAPPSPFGVVLFHALLDRRIVLLPLNARLSEVEQSEALARLRPRVLFVSREVDARRAERLASAGDAALVCFAPEAGGAPTALRLERQGPADRDPGASPRGAEARVRDREVLARTGAALVLLTSGTSGRSKGVVLKRANLLASAEASMAVLPQRAGDRWLLCLPLFHVGGLSILIRSALAGTAVVLHERFDAERVARALERDRITQVSLVATMLGRLLEVRGEAPAPAALRLVLLGGGPAPEALLARARARGYPVAPTYGLTEAASQVATRAPGDPLPSDGDLAGGLRPLPGVEVRIVDAQGRALPAGVEGEIRVRGPNVMAGYLDDPEATAAVLADGWLATGDVGRLDGSGGLRVLDRRADLIVSGGENVYPAEVESVLEAHPAIAEAGVVGRPDEEFGARPVAFVVLREGMALDPEELARFCRARLAGYKLPVAYHEIDGLPRTASGKLRRRRLAERAAGPDAQGRGGA